MLVSVPGDIKINTYHVADFKGLLPSGEKDEETNNHSAGC